MTDAAEAETSAGISVDVEVTVALHVPFGGFTVDHVEVHELEPPVVIKDGTGHNVAVLVVPHCVTMALLAVYGVNDALEIQASTVESAAEVSSEVVKEQTEAEHPSDVQVVVTHALFPEEQDELVYVAVIVEQGCVVVMVLSCPPQVTTGVVVVVQLCDKLLVVPAGTVTGVQTTVAMV